MHNFHYTVFTVLIAIFSNCTHSTNKSQSDSSKICGCLEYQIIPGRWYIDAINDSVVFCGREKTSEGDYWVDKLSKNTFLGNEGAVYYCRTGEAMEFGHGAGCSMHYKNKRLIVKQQVDLYIYHPKKQKWLTVRIDAYELMFYAKNGRIHKTESELILKPPKFPKTALTQLNKIFEESYKLNMPYKYDLMACLLTGALCRDSISRQRLMDFEKYFPNLSDRNKEVLNYKRDFLNKYETWLKNGGKFETTDLKDYFNR